MLFKKFDEKTGVLNVEARGNIDFWELLDFYKTLVTDNSYPKKLKVLFNALNIKFDFSIKYNEDISKAILKVVKKYDIIKEAFIVEEEFFDPVTLMFDDKFVYENFSFKVFNNINAAKFWIDF